jgi:hypothetical protein
LSSVETCFRLASFSKSALPVSTASDVSTIVPGEPAHALTDTEANKNAATTNEVRMTESYVTREKLDDRSDVQ